MIELLLQAETALSGGALDQAERVYWQLVERDSHNAIAVAGLARVSLERGDRETAHLFAIKALVLDPDSVAAQKVVEALQQGGALPPAEPADADLPLLAAERLEALSRRRRAEEERRVEPEQSAPAPEAAVPGGQPPDFAADIATRRRGPVSHRPVQPPTATPAAATPPPEPPATTPRAAKTPRLGPKSRQWPEQPRDRGRRKGGEPVQPVSDEDADQFAAAEAAAAIEAIDAVDSIDFEPALPTLHEAHGGGRPDSATSRSPEAAAPETTEPAAGAFATAEANEARAVGSTVASDIAPAQDLAALAVSIVLESRAVAPPIAEAPAPEAVLAPAPERLDPFEVALAIATEFGARRRPHASPADQAAPRDTAPRPAERRPEPLDSFEVALSIALAVRKPAAAAPEPAVAPAPPPATVEWPDLPGAAAAEQEALLEALELIDVNEPAPGAQLPPAAADDAAAAEPAAADAWPKLADATETVAEGTAPEAQTPAPAVTERESEAEQAPQTVPDASPPPAPAPAERRPEAEPAKAPPGGLARPEPKPRKGLLRRLLGG